MQLADWARQNGLDYKTGYRLFRSGKFLRPIEQLPAGTILVHELPSRTNDAVLYARVSSSDQKEDLERQLDRLRDFAAANGLHVVGEFKEVGAGLNGHRKVLLKILENPSFSVLVVEHRDRLARSGSDYIEACLKAGNRELKVANEQELNMDLVQDMVDVLTSFCARLYGQRSAKNRAKRAVEAAQR